MDAAGTGAEAARARPHLDPAVSSVPGADADAQAAFVAFVRTASDSLHRTAYLLTGSREAAQDAVQAALTRVYLAWHRRSEWDSWTAYTRQTLVNVVLSDRRRRWSGERAFADVPERPQADSTAVLLERDALRRALQALPTRQRTAVVLRHYLDLSEAQAAAEMGCPVGSIKSLTSRGLDALRDQLEKRAS
jgi:RNA polymerase sigma-70 factor (sigma-E family)